MSPSLSDKASIGPFSFDNCFFDEEEDALYLHRGEPRAGLTWESPEGHLIRIDPESGDLIGVTIFDYHRSHAQGEISITFPNARDLSGRVGGHRLVFQVLEAIRSAVGAGRSVEHLVAPATDEDRANVHVGC